MRTIWLHAKLAQTLNENMSLIRQLEECRRANDSIQRRAEQYEREADDLRTRIANVRDLFSNTPPF